MVTIERQIHAVGQGLFCSEILRLDKEIVHTVIYDCGSENREKLRADIEDFKDVLDEMSIDAVFISHFHRDHINGINELIRRFDIKKVYLPQLDPYQIVRSHYEGDYGNDIDYIIRKVFASRSNDGNKDSNENETIFIEVPPFINVDYPFLRDALDAMKEDYDYEIFHYFHDIKIINNIDDYRKEVNLNYSHQIHGFTNSNSSSVEYIPFNIVDENSILFNYLFIKEHRAYMRNRERIFDLLNDEKYWEQIKSMYEKVYRDVNESSMPVLSYSIGTISEESCLYTGDYSHKVDKYCNLLKTFYKEKWSSIKTIQVPHHGSRLDNPRDLYTEGHYQCVVSYGEMNRYGHPDVDTINNINSSGCNSLTRITEETNPFVSRSIIS